MSVKTLLVSTVFLVAACTSSLGNNNPDLSGGDMALPPNATIERLAESDYSIAAGDEFYQCQRITLTADVNIVRFQPVSPLGVHHQVLAIDPTPGPDGVTNDKGGDCSPTDPDWKPLFASGINSPSLQLPDNVAFVAKAGQQIVLDLHLFNASTNTITGKAALDIGVVPDITGYELAGVPFVGNINFTIGANLTVNGSCSVNRATKMFAVFPHMHQSGSHIKITAGATTVWDDDYSFMDQRFGFYPNWGGPAEVDLAAGDKIAVTCTYDSTGLGKKFGDSTTKEMCFAISWVHPAINTTAGTPFCLF